MIELTSVEIAAYYAVRAPNLAQPNRDRWRGWCPLHGGDGQNFTVSAASGLWRCFSKCGRGGDVIAFEMDLTGTPFKDAKRSVFAIIGRVDDPRASWPSEADRRDTPLAAMWRTGALALIHAQLLEAKEGLAINDDVESIGEFVGCLTQMASWHRGLSGARLLDAFRKFAALDPRTTRELVARAIDDESNAREWATCLIRLLELTAIQARGVAA